MLWMATPLLVRFTFTACPTLTERVGFFWSPSWKKLSAISMETSPWTATGVAPAPGDGAAAGASCPQGGMPSAPVNGALGRLDRPGEARRPGLVPRRHRAEARALPRDLVDRLEHPRLDAVRARL